jgi:hypothetical protein
MIVLLLKKYSLFVLYKDGKVGNNLRISYKAVRVIQELPSLFFIIKDLDLRERVIDFVVPKDSSSVVHNDLIY